MKPGRSVASPRSIISAPAGAAPPTETILPPSMTRRPGEATVPDLESKILAALSAIAWEESAASTLADATRSSNEIARSAPANPRLIFLSLEVLAGIPNEQHAENRENRGAEELTADAVLERRIEEQSE